MYLISEVRKRKYLEIDTEINKFEKDNQVNKDFIIYSLTLDKKVFALEVEVREYLASRLYDYFTINEDEKFFYVSILNTTNLDKSREAEIDLRRGVKVIAAPFKRYEEFQFNDKSTSDKINTEVPDVIMIARVAKGTHPRFGKVEITKDMLTSFEKNFNDKVVGVDLAINEDHEKKEAFGWYKEVFLNESGDELFAKVKWNKKGTVSLNEGEYRYFSPEYRDNFIHNLDGKEYGPTLMGGALTNYPFLKMDAITELNEGVSEMDLKELNEKNAKLSSQVMELSDKLKAGLDSIKELSEKNSKLEAEKEKMEKEKVNEKLFLDKKINKAQLVALNEGKGFLEVLALAEDINFNENGTTKNVDTVELSEADAKAAKAFGLTAEEYRAYNK